MIDIDRMIGRLMQLVQDTNLTLSQSSSGEYRIAEMVLGDHLRTRECKEDTTLLDFLEGFLVQTGVALQRIMQRSTMFSKGRRVENDEIVARPVGRGNASAYRTI